MGRLPLEEWSKRSVLALRVFGIGKALSLIIPSDSVLLQAKPRTGTTESMEGRAMQRASNTGRPPDGCFPWPGLSLGADRSPCIDSHKTSHGLEDEQNIARHTLMLVTEFSTAAFVAARHQQYLIRVLAESY